MHNHTPQSRPTCSCAVALCTVPLPCVQLVLRNMFFFTPPVPLPHGALLIERYRHRNASATEPPRRTKPILRLAAVGPYSGNPHRFSMDSGTSVTQHPEVVRLNHYWGLRLHGFRPMPRDQWAQCVEDYSIQVCCCDALQMLAGRTARGMPCVYACIASPFAVSASGACSPGPCFTLALLPAFLASEPLS